MKKLSIYQTFLSLLALMGGLGLSSLQAKGSVVVKSKKDLVSDVVDISCYDFQNKQVAVQQYVEMVRESNPVVYDKLQPYLKHNRLFKNKLSICTIPGCRRWAILKEKVTTLNNTIERAFLVCPCDKEDITDIDDVIIKCCLFLEESLQFAIRLDTFDFYIGYNFNMCLCSKEIKDWLLLESSINRFYARVRAIISKHPQVSFNKVMFFAVPGMRDWRAATMKFRSERYHIIACPYHKFLTDFDEADEGNFLHEMGHVENRENMSIFSKILDVSEFVDRLKLPWISIASLCAAQICASQSKSKLFFNSAALLSGLGYMINKKVIRQIDECKADDFACKQGDTSTLLGFRNFFDLCRMRLEQLCFKKRCIAKAYMFLFDEHPSCQFRIAKIDKELLVRSQAKHV